jgi:hypothetical protein
MEGRAHRLIVILSATRTGSTALGYALESGLPGSWFFEIFDETRADPDV